MSISLNLISTIFTDALFMARDSSELALNDFSMVFMACALLLTTIIFSGVMYLTAESVNRV